MTSIEVELVMSLLAMSLGLGLHQQEGQLGQRKVVGCTQRVQTAWLLLGLAIERSWLALCGPFLSYFACIGFKNSLVALWGLHF